MKVNCIALLFLLGAGCGLSTSVLAQTDSTRLMKERQASTDDNTKKVSSLNPEAQQDIVQKRAERLKDAEALEKDNKAIAKETSRVNKDAAYAARESKLAAKAEQKAQRLRKKADRLADKAAAATQKSNQN